MNADLEFLIVASAVNNIQDVIYKDVSGFKDEEGNFHTVEVLNSK